MKNALAKVGVLRRSCLRKQFLKGQASQKKIRRNEWVLEDHDTEGGALKRRGSWETVPQKIWVSEDRTSDGSTSKGRSLERPCLGKQGYPKNEPLKVVTHKA